MIKLERRLLGRDRKRFQGLGLRDLELRVLPSAGIEMASTNTKSRAKAGFGQARSSPSYLEYLNTVYFSLERVALYQNSPFHSIGCRQSERCQARTRASIP